MTPERWQQIEQLYHAVRAHPPAECQALIAEACIADEALRREVESLLAFDEQARSFIEMPPDDIAAGLLGAGQARSMVGRTLGHYRLHSLLGAGGMGEVYRARDLRLDRDVAVKILPEHLADNAEALRRFEREAKAVAALSHPNILAIHDFGAEQGVSYAVMELLEGETLRGRLRNGALAWREAVEIGLAVAEGLATAHAKGIIHRDLKPENIFLTSAGLTTAGVVKILDFGIARVKRVVLPGTATPSATAPETTRPGLVIGTLGYMSPEQVRGEEADAPSDIFSLGCVLYEMLSGERPFARAIGVELIAAILDAEPPALAGSGKKLPAELERIIRHCLQKNADVRYQAARALASDLRAVLGASGQRLSAPLLARRRLRTAALLAGTLLLFVVLALALYLFARREQTLDSLAVLPLVNASSDEQTEILSEGISESLINSLSQLPQLKRVIARSTVARYKGKEIDPGKVGQELNVRALLIGKMIRRGDDLIIETELVNTADGARLWGGQYPLRLADVLAVQTEIARQISEKLRLRLTGEQRQRLTKHQTENAEAYKLYLWGRHHSNRHDTEGWKKGIEYMNQAVALDPAYALAYAGLAAAYYEASSVFLPASEAMPKVVAAARQALLLDETLAEAHTALAQYSAQYEWNWAEAEKEYRRALELNPSYATAHQYYGFYLTEQGRLEEALVAMTEARKLDPLTPYISANLAWIHYLARRPDEALAQNKRLVEAEPKFAVAHYGLGLNYQQKGMIEEAIVEFEQARSLDPENPFLLALLGQAYAISGKQDDARRMLAALQERAKHRLTDPFNNALIYVGLGEKDQVFAWLEKAYDFRSEGLLTLKVEPLYDSLRADPRFTDLLRRMNLAPLAQDGREQAKHAGAVAPAPMRGEVMRYALELKAAAGASARVTGREPLAAGQRFKFHFTAREPGYLYLIALGARNVPTTLLTARPFSAWGVTTNRIEAGADYSFPAGADNWLRTGSYGSVNTFTVIFAPAPLTAPGCLAAPANRQLTAADQRELEQLWQQFGKQTPAAETRGYQASVGQCEHGCPSGAGQGRATAFRHCPHAALRKSAQRRCPTSCQLVAVFRLSAMRSQRQAGSLSDIFRKEHKR